MKHETLLAVDAGVKIGLALYGKPASLIWYRSHNMGSLASLRRAAFNLLRTIDNLSWLVVEGGGPVAATWIKEAGKLGIRTISTDAGKWRKELLYPREFRNTATAKQNAIALAGLIIQRSSAPSVNAPNHDAAEAVLIGLWGCKTAGWIDQLPPLHT